MLLFHCFLQFGYAKTSMDDVASNANLSRPLIYLRFKKYTNSALGTVMTLITITLVS